MIFENIFRKQRKGPEDYQQLAIAVENQVRHRTNGRVKQLDVQVLDGTVIVFGTANSYYGKQLALEGIVDVLGSTTDIQLNIDVNYQNGNAAETEAGDIDFAPARSAGAL